MKHIRSKPILTVVKGTSDTAVAVPASSIITVEIGGDGALRRLEVNVRKEDVLQALQGLAMANLRALDLLVG